jgi:transposase-like protein
MAFEDKTRVLPAGGQAPACEQLREMVSTVVARDDWSGIRALSGGGSLRAHSGTARTSQRELKRTLKTRVGALVLDVPRDRAGLFRASLFAKYERSEQALVLAMVEMYFHGVSTRKVNAVVEQLCGTSISASEVSALTRKLDASLTAWRERRLADTQYPALVVDAHVEQVRREGHVRATAALWVVGVTPEGHREHLGIWLGPSESEASWAQVFHDLAQRGLHGVTYVVSDDHVGLRAALRRYFPDAVQQRCQVHYLRNALSKVDYRPLFPLLSSRPSPLKSTSHGPCIPDELSIS